MGSTFLRAPETDGASAGGGTATAEPPGGGSNPFAPGSASSTPETSTPAQPTTPTQPSAPVQPAPTGGVSTPPPPAAQPVVGLSQDQLTTLLQAARQPAASQGQPATPAAQPTMTDGDFKKAFNIFEATPELYEQILGVKPDSPARVEALNNALQSISKQSITVVRYLMEQRLKAVEDSMQSKLGPITQERQQATEERYYQEFSSEYPGLKDYKPLLSEVVTAAQARGLKFNNAAEAKNFVATQACKLLGKTVESVKVTSNGAATSSGQATTQQPAARQMSTMSMGGRSGASGATPVQSTAERLFN